MSKVLMGQNDVQPTFSDLVEHCGDIVCNVFLKLVEV